MTRLRVVLIGAVDSTRVTLDALIGAQCAPALLVTLPVENASMHSDFVDLAPVAARHGIPVLATKNVNCDDVIAQVKAIDPDFLFVVGWSRLVGRKLCACARRGVLGYHPAPLPRGRGRSALAWTILLGMRETAGTLFWIDEGVDAGPIAAQVFFPLSLRVDLPELYAQHMEALTRMLPDLLADLKAGRMTAIAQDEGEASYFAQRRPEDGRIDWSDDAEKIDRLVRAVTHPYPGAFTTIGGGRMIIWRGEPVGMPQWHAQVGQIFLIQDDALYVRCGADSSYRVDDYELVADAGGIPPIIKGQLRLGEARGRLHA
jgi:methionyl-tRNA formyltransferase